MLDATPDETHELDAQAGEAPAKPEFWPMKSSLRPWRRIAILLVRLAVGGLFVFAGARKAFDPLQFLVDILNFQMVAYPIAVASALTLPWLEIVAGFAVGFRRWRASSLFILLLLLVAFSGVIVSAWVRGLEVPCGCFGASSVASGPGIVLLRNLLLLSIVGFLMWRERKDVLP